MRGVRRKSTALRARLAGGSLSTRPDLDSFVGLTKPDHAVMLAFKPIPSDLGTSDQTMTIGITGRRRWAPWRGAVVGLIIAVIVLLICLILLVARFNQFERI